MLMLMRRLPALMVYLIAASATVCMARDAEIVSLIGKGDRKDTAAADWRSAVLRDQVPTGGFVRTQADSQMALLLADRTQLRLQQNTQLQIKSVADQKEWQQTTLQLQQGRAWSQARPQARPAGADPKAPAVSMETPSVTLAIRGTDWDIEVDREGRTRVAVLSGVVELANEQGSLQVRSGEGALAEVGKAPVRLFLANPRERVQWVTAYRPQPRRWVPAPAGELLKAAELIGQGSHGRAAALLDALPRTELSVALMRADLMLFEGAPDAAAALLVPHAGDGAGAPMAAALLARALMLADRHAEAGTLLKRALHAHAGHEEVRLAAADLAVFSGDAKSAREHYAAVTQAAPQRYEAWLGLGRIETERENFRRAQQLLEQAAAAAPQAAEPRAELATLMSLVGNLDTARRLFDELLVERPDDYLALTGRGITRLKAGDARGGLEDFLRAGVIEPRYARAWLYSGVAFYQAGDAARALDAFRKAGELDPRDPLPELMAGIVSGDAMELGAAIASARRGQELMPYLKSLNQVMNNQKGHASLGSPLASFNLEAWAAHLAAEAYSPFWAGSYLFMADRQSGSFNKNSELFKGFLADPTVFGASNRQSSIVASPGHYGSVDVGLSGGDIALGEVVASVNGLSVAPVPFAYFISGTAIDGHSRVDDFSVGSHTLTVGLGARPRHDIGIFGFAKDSRIDVGIDRMEGGLNDADMMQAETQGDIGFNYKISATQQIWVKAGSGRQRTRVKGGFYSPETEQALDTLFMTNVFGPNGRLDPYATDLDHEGLQFRHVFDAGDALEIHWGAEDGRQDKRIATSVVFAPAVLRLDQAHRIDSQVVWAGLRWKASETFLLQAELHRQAVRSATRQSQGLTVTGIPPFVLANTADRDRIDETNPRLGVRWIAAPGRTLRAAFQQWRRPAGINTLAPIDTLGIPLNDRLVAAGGLYRRTRLQYEHQAGDRLFVMGYADRERVRNLLGPSMAIIDDAELLELGDLRNRKPIFGAPWDDYEGTPGFGRGQVVSWGIAANMLVSDRTSLAARYVRASTSNQGAGKGGLDLPYIPRHTFRTSLQWLLPQRWAVQVGATWRSARFEDEENLKPLRAGWVFGASAHWESADKRWLFETRLDNLRAEKQASKDRLSALSAKLGYRF